MYNITNEDDTVKIMYGSSRPKNQVKHTTKPPIRRMEQLCNLHYTKYPIKYPGEFKIGKCVEGRGYPVKFHMAF